MTPSPLSSPRPAVCLLSGGMDSAVVLAEAKAMGFEVHALSFRYGQRQWLAFVRNTAQPC